MRKSLLAIYLVTLMILFVPCAIVWHWQMAGTYFVSQRKGIILDFLPPFVQTGTDGDLYLKPERTVYIIWAVYAGITVIVPAISAWLLVRMHDKALKKAWR